MLAARGRGIELSAHRAGAELTNTNVRSRESARLSIVFPQLEGLAPKLRENHAAGFNALARALPAPRTTSSPAPAIIAMPRAVGASGGWEKMTKLQKAANSR